MGMEENGVNLDSGSPTESQVETGVDTTLEVQQSEGQQTSDSPTDKQEGEKEPASVFEAAKLALKATAESDKKAETSESPTDDGQESAKDTKSAEDEIPTAEDMLKDKSIPQKTKKRIESLLGERLELSQTVEQLQPQANNWSALQNWVEQNGFAEQEFNNLLGIGALVKTNPVRAELVLQGVLDDLRKQNGTDGLPSDIQDKLDRGLVDEETAKELAMTRRLQNSDARANQRFNEQQQQEEVSRQTQQTTVAIQTSIANWEKNWRDNDPDYTKLQPLVMDALRAKISVEGKATTPQGAIEQLKQSLETVKENIRKFVPQPTAKQPPPKNNGGSINNAAPKPKSSFEAAKLSLDGKQVDGHDD